MPVPSFLKFANKIAFSVVTLIVLSLPNPSTSLAVDFVETARFNLDEASSDAALPYYIGSNPAAVAWSGSQLYVAGFNNSGATDFISIVEVENATASGLVDSPTYQVLADSVLESPNARGYTGLDFDPINNQLAVTLDTGADSPSGLQVYSTETGNLSLWTRNIRGTSGVSFDPGFEGNGDGIATTKWGSGRRLLYDAITGSTIYDETDGMFWTSGFDGTLTRDIDFDPGSGDIYVRHNNFVSLATRDDENSSTLLGPIGFLDQADFVAQQNLSVMSVPQGDAISTMVIFNDRQATNSGQTIENVIRLFEPNGTERDIEFDLLDTVPDGNGAYDFDYDFATNTLAILDFANRNVHIFDVGDTSFPLGDFNNDGVFDCIDIDALVSEIAAGSNNLDFDLTGEGILNQADIDLWLETAGSTNLASGNPYLKGDANLDGVVDVGDFNIWNSNKFTAASAWCYGDFNADGVVDVADFNVWNSNKFQASDVAAVPEPSGYLLLLGLSWIIFRRK